MPARGARLAPTMTSPKTRLQKRLQDATAERSVQQVADQWEIPYWVLRDTARGATDCPRGLYLPNMARGLGISTDQLIEDAYAAYSPAEKEAAAVR